MRVACVGDSITHGVGLQANETYPAQLQRRLRADGRADAEVLNFGLNGASLAGASVGMKSWESSGCEQLAIMTLRSSWSTSVFLSSHPFTS